MKTQIQKIIGLLTISSLLFVSCETVDFGDENLNPNRVSKANTGALITNAMRSIPGLVSNVNPLLLVQHVSEITYNDSSCYETIQWNFDGYYTGPLMDLQTVINLNTEDPASYTSSGSTGMQMGVAHLLQVYYFQKMTDRWGSIPYSESLMGVENLKPKFDDQKDIYMGMFAQIDLALGLLDGGGLNGDYMFGGSATSWKKFGNTMKMVMALRVSDADASTAQSKFMEAHNGGVIGAGGDIHYPYTAADANDAPWQDRFQSRDDFASSDTMVEHLIASSDPRLHKYAVPVEQAGGVAGGAAKVVVNYTTVDGKVYGGMPYGVLTPGILQSWVSYLPDAVIRVSAARQGGMLFSYAQVALCYAEAAQRGWSVPGTAQSWYEAGIAASMTQWGVSAADSATYIASVGAASTQTIATEKWKALYMQGEEAWSEWRRLDYPVLVRATDWLTGTGIPVRLGYGAYTASANKANHDAAVAKVSGYSQDSRVWWDTK
jgi:hypothetical protein